MKLEAPGLDAAEQSRLVLVVEGRVAPEQGVDDHAHTPHVHRLFFFFRFRGKVQDMDGTAGEEGQGAGKNGQRSQKKWFI